MNPAPHHNPPPGPALRAAAGTIVLTRAKGQSAELMRLLARRSVNTFEFPLFEILPPLDHAPLKRAFAALGRYALAIFVSPNAIEQAFTQMPAPWPSIVPIGVIGPASVRALQRYGIAAPHYQVIAPPSADDSTDNKRALSSYDSEALAAALDGALGLASLARRTVLIIRGDEGRDWLTDVLRAQRAAVEIVAAYRRAMPAPAAAAWQRIRALLAGEPHAWLLTSSLAVRHLDMLARTHLNQDEQAALKRAAIVAPHARIAESARAAGFVTITQTSMADDKIVRALLAAIDSIESTGMFKDE